ncbi:MAG TPA: hypothetical protein PKW80_02460 [Bacteroidales bacterium]|nr:hypothetical protein [Bacteroidales bacterium]
MTILNKNKFFLFLILTLAFTDIGFAQIRISSPYSRYGLGELQTNHSVYTSSMGGLNIALRNPNFINMNNPASYSSFDTNSFIFDAGVISTFSQLKTNINSQGYNNHTSLGHLLFGFPVTRWCGISLGLIPVSKSGYLVKVEDTIEDAGRVTERFTGSGGLSHAYLGASFKPFKNFSFGINIGYLFGTIYKVRAVEFPDDAFSFNVRAKNDVEVGGIFLNYGLQYQIFLKKNYTLTLGSKFNLPMNLNAKHTLLDERYSGSETDIISIKDTLIDITDKKGKIFMPLTIGGGFTLTKNNIWMVGADFDWQNWKKFKSFGVSDSIGNSFIVSAGGEYTPQYNALTSYWKRMNYRAGFHFSQSYYEIRDTKINDFSVSIGLGFPIKKTRTTVNVAFEAGTKGTISKNLLQENYFRLIVGIAFREFWFFRPKLN